jgi:ribonuclease M5
MIKIKQAVIVEGKYDKIKLSGIIDAPIIQTDGFGIFKDKELQAMIRKLAEKRGILVLTDSDSAGFKIRSFIRGIVPNELIKHAYIPDVPGKERRKAAPGKEGKLGVEGMTREVLLEALRRAGATFEDGELRTTSSITKQDMMELGLSGGANSSILRQKLMEKLEFPKHMSANALLDALNLLYSLEELTAIIDTMETENG